MSTTPHNGSAWAALLAAGIGCLALGVLIDLAEAFPKVSSALNFYNPVGDLSGKSSIAVAIWLFAWAILHAKWKTCDILATGSLTALILVLVLLGQLAAFPPFFELFVR